MKLYHADSVILSSIKSVPYANSPRHASVMPELQQMTFQAIIYDFAKTGHLAGSLFAKS